MIFFQQNKQRGRLFQQAHQKGWQFSFATVLAVFFMFADHHYGNMPIHRIFSCVIYPVQYVMDAPTRLIQWTRLTWTSKQALLAENERLRHQQLYLQSQNMQSLMLQDENTSLKELLALSQTVKHRSMAADVLAVSTGHTRQVVIINKGKQAGVVLGQLVLDTQGVMGQVIDVGLRTSTILLISDANSAVPVKNQRTGEKAILNGTNSTTQLSLINLPKTVSVQKGDVLLTSGLGQQYPAGYPVGVVEKVTLPPGEDFIRVSVRPLTALARNQLVLLVWPDEQTIALNQEVGSRLRKQKVQL
ncbi:MAG: rod shape-determining protein MreC [Legionellaceae bacterium]|nr:rod shape-determining protein MreC [Legionellaceae bacterium]